MGAISLPPEKELEVGGLELDPRAEKRLVRKLDLHIIPVVMLLYLLSFLDRSASYENRKKKYLDSGADYRLESTSAMPRQTSSAAHSIVLKSNPSLYGLRSDLSLTPTQYQTAVSVLFVTYILSELPSNLILKKYVRPSRWIAFITTAWGIIATLTGLSRNYAGLLACRL
ncbi:hypothetical protein LTR28_009368, partial [Elasticomyces elasticus]